MNRNGAPEHGHELQVSGEDVMDDGIPVIGPIYLRSVAVPVLDVFGGSVIDETTLGKPCCDNGGTCC